MNEAEMKKMIDRFFVTRTGKSALDVSAFLNQNIFKGYI